MSSLQKIQLNKALTLTFAGLASAGALAYFFYKKSSAGCPKKSQQQCPMKKSLCDKLGGKVNIDAAVIKFYEKVLADDRVKHFFKNTDMPHQIKQQQDFLCMAFGGPNKYSGKNMVDAHKGMQITDEQYNAIVENLAKTLSEMGVPQEVINEVAAACEPLRKDICYK